MPTVSTFHGITIRMYYEDHGPPHFHAIAGGEEAMIRIGGPDLMEGSLPRRAMSLVLDWATRHQIALRNNWTRAAAHEPLLPIPPLE